MLSFVWMHAGNCDRMHAKIQADRLGTENAG